MRYHPEAENPNATNEAERDMWNLFGQLSAFQNSAFRESFVFNESNKLYVKFYILSWLMTLVYALYRLVLFNLTRMIGAMETKM